MKVIYASLLAFLVLFSQAVRAADASAEGPDLPVRYDYVSVAYVLNGDASFTETREMALTILKESAVGWAKRYTLSYSASLQKAEILEAYTRKADGRRLDSSPASFQVETNAGRGDGGPAFSDMTTMTVIFPEVQVGDTVVLTYRLKALQPMFPGHFSVAEYFPRRLQYNSVRIRIDAPASLWAQYDAREFQPVQDLEADGRRVLEWTFANPKPPVSKRRNYSVFDVEKEPGVAYSTFRSYADVVEAYGQRARPKAAVSERIRMLADEIVKDGLPPRETAKALYDWVAVNTTYAGNCIGLGAVVPRDLDFVLDNRMGDCKDKATLLQALLAAKGIASTQALVNAGASYRLPKVPVVSMVNHVINYIPALDLFADPTSDSTPFGMLPFTDADKPVLLVDGYKDGIKTPALAAGTNRQTMKHQLTVGDDGSVRGEVSVALQGMYAANARARLRHMNKEMESDLVKNMFKEMGYQAQGSFDKDDPKELLDTYAYRAKFEVQNIYAYPGAGAFPIAPFFYNEAPVAGYISQALQIDDEPVDSACSSGQTVEEYTYVLPARMKILSLPEDLKLSNDFLTYEATYRKKGNSLVVRRVLDDRTKGNVCGPSISAAYRDFARKVLPNLKAQVVYK